MKKRCQALLVLVALPLLLAAGCARVQAKAAMKDGNKAYKEENYKQAIEEYTRATELDPNMAEAWFYLGSSHQALYRPGKDTPENKDHLTKAIEFYKKSLEVNSAQNEGMKRVKANALSALTAIHSDDPMKDFEAAQGYAQQLIQDSPDDPRNLYAIANLYEKFGRIQQAEDTYRKIETQSLAAYRKVVPEGSAPPSAPPPAAEGEATASPAYDALQNAWKACGAVAAFYNKPLWDETGAVWEEASQKPRRSRFDDAIGTLERCTLLKPDEAEGYQKLATFYWDKAFRDPLLDDAKKEEYAEKGLQAVDRALSIKPDYFEAIIYKGLLYRVKAQVAKNPKLRAQYLDQAAMLQKQGLEMKKEQQAATASDAAPGPSSQ
jgi:tetratricopeptide (TPR) repeat protein